MKILVVDDNAGIGNALVAGIQSYGYRAFWASGGPQALDMIETAGTGSEPFDTVITDMQMPGMDGLEFIRSVKKAHPRLPCLLIPGSNLPEILKKILEFPLCSVLEKPFTPECLMKTLEDLRSCNDQRSTPFPNHQRRIQ